MQTEPTTTTAIDLCLVAHERLLATAGRVDDDTARRPSLLPGWSVGHVLTHLARNAEGHALRLDAALRGEDVPRYPGGPEERDRGIEEGAGRPAERLRTDVAESAAGLEDVWARSEEAGWPNSGFQGDDRWPTTGSPLRRLREVEMHHADLGLGYTPADWPEEYVAWDLPKALKGLPRRLSGPADSRRVLAWLTGRAECPEDLRLRDWM